MTRKELFENIQAKKSYLCVGLDTDIEKIPAHLKNEKYPLFEFNKQIIDATIDYTVAYKPNLAFYESLGAFGWENLEKTMEYLDKSGIFTIADAKRGDIGNTSSLYARAFFQQFNFDSVTVAPYMGEDSVKPFLTFDGKWVILLALTSNKGSSDFQQKMLNGKPLYEEVLEVSKQWATADQMMYVVGATKAEKLKEIRQIVPDHFLLVPGVGAQGGSLEEVTKNGINDHCGLLVNASRSIIYASEGADFAIEAKKEAMNMQKEMEQLLDQYL